MSVSRAVQVENSSLHLHASPDARQKFSPALLNQAQAILAQIEAQVTTGAEKLTAEEWQETARRFQDFLDTSAPFFLGDEKYLQKWPEILQKVQAKLQLCAFLVSDLQANYEADPMALLNCVINLMKTELENGKMREGSQWLSQFFSLSFIEKPDIEAWLSNPENQNLSFYWSVLEHWKNMQGN